jgi:hypothetical protein
LKLPIKFILNQTLKMKILLLIATLTVALSAQASVDRTVPLVFTIKATVSVQSGITTTNGAVVTFAAPVKYSINTAGLLSELATNEFNEKNYPSASFPAGSKLIYLYDLDDLSLSQNHFHVVDRAGGFVCDVSDIVSISRNDSNPSVSSGGYNPQTGLYTKSLLSYDLRFNFDETGAGGNVKFYLDGIVADTETDVPTSKGVNYTTTETLKTTSLAGTGTLGAGGLVISGSVNAAGKASF